ncbi:TPA: glycosyl transferase [Candidatus Gastranaerophilales bacterium HUM_2]|nr:MAG TPA: glycosyl transferase [Candidatus Gastranaerophilales bacterium HUM_2]
MEIKMPKVSIIIPCYNQGKYVAEAINSALRQTFKDIEIVCVNDGSTDNSVEIIKSFENKYKNFIFLNNKENRGVIYSRNFAIKNCNGTYILPLDADDIIEPTYVEKAVKILDNNSNIGIVYCKAKIFGNYDKYWNLKPFNKSDILYENCIFCSALFRKSDFLKIGGYNNNMKYGCEDYDLWLSFIEQGLEVFQINEILFSYRQYDETSRTTISLKNKKEIWNNLIKNHINLYLNDENFLERLIFSNPIKTNKKYKKYKKMFNKLFPITIIELIIIIGLFILLVL